MAKYRFTPQKRPSGQSSKEYLDELFDGVIKDSNQSGVNHQIRGCFYEVEKKYIRKKYNVYPSCVNIRKKLYSQNYYYCRYDIINSIPND